MKAEVQAQAHARALAREADLGSVRAVERLPGGANNRVFRVRAGRGDALLKLYHHDPEDPRDRAATEFAFASFAWRGGLRQIAQPLAIDAARHTALFAWLGDVEPVLAPIGDGEVHQALRFFADLNQLRTDPGSASLPLASEACFRAEEHIDRVDARVAALRDIPLVGDAGGDAARSLVRDELQPRWEEVRRQARAALRPGAGDAESLANHEQCLSPSDFGFHNALRRRDGTLIFIDFEYAGWDDPAKVVVDFFCQPKVPVPLTFWDRFVAGVDAAVGADSDLDRRARILLDVYRIKWCCIRLNEFTPAAARRRSFARGDDTVEHRSLQLESARDVLATIGTTP